MYIDFLARNIIDELRLYLEKHPEDIEELINIKKALALYDLKTKEQFNVEVNTL